MFKELAILGFTVLVLGGCATMDKSECLTADWRTVGFEDGSNGKPETAISEYRQDCAKHGVAPELTLYRQGHREGSERYCTRRNGFVVGKRGGGYQNSCAADLEAGFLVGYNDGKALHDLQRALSTANSALQKQHRLVSDLAQSIAAKKELLVADGLVKDERLAILADIEALNIDLLDASQQLPLLEREVRRAEHALAQAEQNLSGYN